MGVDPTYGPQLHCLSFMIEKRKLFTVYYTMQMRSPYTEHVASGLPNPTQEGEVRFVEAQDQQVTTRSPRW